MSEEQRFVQFAQFHESNPEVWELFKRFTLEAITSGKKVGARLIGERLRWERLIVIKRTDSKFEINNNHWPFYARLFAEEFPQHSNFFEFRKKSPGG